MSDLHSAATRCGSKIVITYSDVIAGYNRGAGGAGRHIVLFELPSAPGIRETEYVKAAHILAKESFSGAEKWLAISDDRSELRWVDASHMDERSAIIVARQIDRFLALVAR